MNDFIDVNGFEGFYKVNPTGEIYSCRVGRVIKNRERGQYLFVELQDKSTGRNDQESIHRIVANNFISNPENKPCVNHIDGNKHNNHVSNLEWVTRSENTKHAFKTGLMHIPKGERKNVSKLTNADVFKIRMLALTMSNRKIAKQFTISHQTVNRVVNRETWNHI